MIDRFFSMNKITPKIKQVINTQSFRTSLVNLQCGSVKFYLVLKIKLFIYFRYLFINLIIYFWLMLFSWITFNLLTDADSNKVTQINSPIEICTLSVVY